VYHSLRSKSLEDFEFLEFYCVTYRSVTICAVRDAEIEVYWISKNENLWLLKELLQTMTY